MKQEMVTKSCITKFKEYKRTGKFNEKDIKLPIETVAYKTYLKLTSIGLMVLKFSTRMNNFNNMLAYHDISSACFLR